MTKPLFPLVLLGAALSACSGEQPAPIASETAPAVPPPPAESPAIARPEAAPSDPASMPATAAPAPAIPTAMRGRFGLVPDDCTSTRGDAKGLMTVGADNLRFYESVARIAAIKDETPRRLRARFAYSGEGMTWSRDATLALGANGNTLVLEEFGDGAVPGPQTYKRCPA